MWGRQKQEVQTLKLREGQKGLILAMRKSKFWIQIGHLLDGVILPFYYYDQNPSSFCFLVQISAFVI